MQVETTESLIITLPIDADYTGIVSEIAHWFTTGSEKQIQALTVSLRGITDSLACVMPSCDTSTSHATIQNSSTPNDSVE